MEKIKIHDKIFVPYIDAITIQNRVKTLAEEIKMKYEGQQPIFLAVLNGAFMFASDLLKHLNFECEIHFIKLSSYQNMTSTGEVKTVIGLTKSITNRAVILIEDIVDTGNTLYHFLPQLHELQPSSVEICALLQKPAALQHDLTVHYVGFEIPNEFVIGYGLDYNDLGRNYPFILRPF